MIDFTRWYFLLKHLTSFLSFFSLYKVTPMSSTYLDYLKSLKIFENKANLAQLSKKPSLLISGSIFFALTVSANWRDNCSIYSSLISCERHVSAWPRYLTGSDLIFFLLSYFLLKMVSVMNDFNAIKKSSPISQCSTELLLFLKVLPKILQISLESTCPR